MKLKICVLAALAVLIVNGEDRPSAKNAKAKKIPAPPPAEMTLPAGAKQVEPGTYTFTDAQGKKWIYRQTPFGLARAEDKPVKIVPAPKDVVITATEAGDVIRFEKPGPFGPYRWEKKKSDLKDDERAAWERSRDSQSNAAKAKKE